jgi:gliding motility-associated-like protein
MKKILLIFTLLFALLTESIGQTCPGSYNQWQWPTHSNWFAGQSQMISFGDSGTTSATVTTQASTHTAYESSASASDEEGNLVIFTNGRTLWDASGTEVTLAGGGPLTLLTGGEIALASTGSAVQGVFITKHPLNSTDYYIFTTDDAIGGRQNGITNGFNYYVYDKATNTCSGATRLGNYRTTEQVAGTFHKNGIDIWIVTHESTVDNVNKNFNAYLLECGGLTATPVVSNLGFSVLANDSVFQAWVPATIATTEYSNERASLEFEPVSAAVIPTTIKAAATHHCGSGTWDKANAVSLMDFNTLTGSFSNSTGVGELLGINANHHSNPYDCEFSADGTRLYVSFLPDQWTDMPAGLFGRLGYFTVPGGVYTEVGNTGSWDFSIGSVKLGGDGTIYGAYFESGGYQYQNSFITSDGVTANMSGLAAGAASVGYGLPNMFIPPADSLIIQTPPAIMNCGSHDFETLWKCKGATAENTPLYEPAYAIFSNPGGSAASINDTTGVFSTDMAGAYRVTFTICSITDTINFNVGSCLCDAQIAPGPLSICAGDSIMLDSLIELASGAGTWTIDSSAGAGSAPTIDIVAPDTMFNTTSATTPGTYKIKFQIDGEDCYDTVYITVNPVPVPSITSMGPFCRNSGAVAMTGSPMIAVDTTGVWKINGVVNAAASFNPSVAKAGDNIVTYTVTVDNCVGTVDSTFIVNTLPVPSITSIGPFCKGDAAVSLSGSPTGTGVGGWKIDEDTILTASFDPSVLAAGNHTVRYITMVKNCTDSIDSVFIIHPIPVPAIATIGPFCAKDGAVSLIGTPNGIVDTTGEWKINGIVNAAGSFSPVDLGVGSHTVTYTATVNNCTDFIDSVFVVNPIPIPAIGSIGPFCATDLAVAMTGSPNAIVDTTGVWEVNSVVDATGSFNPVSLGVGSHTVRYTATVDGCSDFIDSVFIVNALPTPAITALGDYCANDAAEAMVGAPNGVGVTAVWKINDVVNSAGSFDPSKATITDNTVRYIATVNGCTDSTDIAVIVNPTKDATITTTTGNDTLTLCEKDPDDPQVTVAETGGTWNNINVTMPFGSTTATIDLSAIKPVKDLMLIYKFDAPEPCPDADTIWITTTSILDASILAMMDYCISDTTSYVLTKSATANDGGTWWVNGVENPAKIFKPSLLPAGTYSIEQRIGGLCGDTDTVSIVIYPLAVADIIGDTTLCRYHNPITLRADSTDLNWSEIDKDGNPFLVTEVGFTSATLVFDPATAKAGQHLIVHSVSNDECQDIDTAWVTVIDTAKITFGPYGPYCSNGDIVQLSATNSNLFSYDTTGVWSGAAGTSYITSGGLFDPTAASPLTKNAVTYTVGTTCPVFVRDSIEILTAPVVTIVDSVGFCSGDPLYLLAGNVEPNSADSIYSVSSGCGACYNSVTNMFDPGAAGAANSPHTLTLIAGAGTSCPDTAFTIVSITQAAELNLTKALDHCVGEVKESPGNTFQSEITAGSTIGKGYWTVDRGSIDSASGEWSGAGITTGNVTVTATYTFETDNPAPDGCITSETDTLWVYENPVVKFSRLNEDSCVAYADVFTDETVYGSVLKGSTWDFGNGSKGTNVGSDQTNYTVPGEYTVTLSNAYANGCTGTRDLLINVFPIPKADFSWSPNPASVLDPRIEFVSTGDATDDYNWNFTSQGTPTSRSGLLPVTNAVFEVLGDDTVPVTLVVTDNFLTNNATIVGCTDTIIKWVIIQDIFQLYVPNAFTPGSKSDGLNDTFYPQGRNWSTEDYEFVVLDRWGNLIFSTKTIGEGWDGTVNGGYSGGTVAQNDVYVWKVTVKNIYTGKVHKKVGAVTLVQ